MIMFSDGSVELRAMAGRFYRLHIRINDHEDGRGRVSDDPAGAFLISRLDQVSLFVFGMLFAATDFVRECPSSLTEQVVAGTAPHVMQQIPRSFSRNH